MQKGLQSIIPSFEKTKKRICVWYFRFCLLMEHERPYSVSITMKIFYERNKFFLPWTQALFAWSRLYIYYLLCFVGKENIIN